MKARRGLTHDFLSAGYRRPPRYGGNARPSAAWASVKRSVAVTLAVSLVLVACSDDDDDSTGDGSSSSSSSGGSGSGSGSGSGGGAGSGGGCSGKPDGAYRCDGSTGIEVCKDGSWERAGSCGCAVKVGDPRKPPYSATCKVLIGKTNAVECSYASVDCKQCLPGEACETTCTKCASSTSSNCCP